MIFFNSATLEYDQLDDLLWKLVMFVYHHYYFAVESRSSKQLDYFQASLRHSGLDKQCGCRACNKVREKHVSKIMHPGPGDAFKHVSNS